MSLWVPPKIAAELVEERRQFQADVNQQIDPASLNRWDRELRRVDEHLRLVLAKPNAWGTPLKPGYWHIVRDNPGAPPSIMAIEGPNGEYMDPGPHMFDMLAAGDMWDPRFMRQVRAAERRAQVAAERERARLREDRQTELRERVDAATRTQVSMNTSVPYAQNAAGFNRVKGHKKAA